VNSEERLKQWTFGNPCCKECGSPTTKEYAFGFHEYQCSNECCNHFEVITEGVEVTA
jgi:hypothetical protein